MEKSWKHEIGGTNFEVRSWKSAILGLLSCWTGEAVVDNRFIPIIQIPFD